MSGNKMTITRIARSGVQIEYEGKLVTVPGEMLQRVPGSPDFVIYSKMMKQWDSPSSAEIDVDTKRLILEGVCELLAARNITCAIE
jgi:hypothetical protein